MEEDKGAGGGAADDKGGENSTIREMRAQLDAAKNAIKEKDAAIAERDTKLSETTTKLTEYEKAQMTESERVQAELKEAREKAAEAETLRNELGQYTSGLEKVFNTKLSAIPEEHRDRVAKLAENGANWPAKLDILESAIALIPAPAAVAGTRTNAGGGVNNTSGQTFDPKNPPGWGDAFKKGAA